MEKFKKQTSFAVILRNKPIDKNLISVFNKAYSLNKRFFRKTPKKIKIFVCDTEKEIKKKSGRYYQKWGTAYVPDDKTLITRSPEFVEKKGRWKRKDFQNLMNHEVNHVFYQNNYNGYKPIWISEGIACYAGKNFILTKKELKKLIKKYKVDYKILEHRYLVRKFKQGHYPRYPIWAGFTRYIIRRYSVHKISKLMYKYSKKRKKDYYNKLFKDTFGKTEKELFNEFLADLTY